MLQRLIHAKIEELVFPSGVRDTPDNRDYNRIPEPFEEITWDEWISLHGQTVPRFVDMRMTCSKKQMQRLGRTHWTTVYINWYYEYGLATVRPNKWRLEDGIVVYTDRPMYLYIGCRHHNQSSVNIGNCLHRVECHDCGRTKEVDSSG